MTGKSGTTADTILLVEDTLPLARVYREYLEAEGHQVEQVETGTAALDAAGRPGIGVIVLDLKLPDTDGLDVLKQLRARHPDLPVVVVTAHGSISLAVEAMREGAADFLVKPFNAARLTVTVRNACERRKLASMVERYRRDLDRERFHDFIGASAEMQTVYRTIEAVAPSRASVFLTGESGTGKELAADAIHKASPRRAGPFVAINCAAIPKDLLESEIFGHVKGAFSGATADRMGAARQADGGTLFLDEVCEMPLELQPKLLRFIQTGLVQPVGSSKPEKVDVRFVSATNRDPLAEVQAGRFREDLYYRLHVVPVHLPPLREREDDAILIARTLLHRMSAEEGKQFRGFAPEVEAAIRSYDWPGNVRHLENVLRNIVVLNDGPLVTPAMLPDPLRSFHPVTPADPARAPRPTTPAGGGPETATPGTPETPGTPGTPGAPAAEPGIRPLWMTEKEEIQRALAATGNDVPKAAALLEISPSTVYRKIQLWKAEERG
ncbi:sigma-54-dependent transcriptional regulator [Rhodocista pekingensis]|uniref:Sigma 54-interacting transcriptional regulator n=1 Tax=Rhodocista pekingensis TaxID=201185 RepID=A0ABW2KWU0_9PROT